jgi:hypothetical protein
VCDLLFVSCTVCDHDRECRKTIKQVCGSQDGCK